jgi:hypothetical protein
MTKEQWIRHMESVSGLERPENEGGSLPVDWHSAYTIHKSNDPKCPACAARRRTKRAAANAKAIRQAYSDCGMKRVRGALGGVYYE